MNFRDELDARMAAAFAREFDSAAILAGVAEATAPPPPVDFKKNSIAIRVPTDYLIAMGIIPDPRPSEVIEAERAESARKRAAAHAETAVFVAAVDSISDPLARTILDLHHRDGGRYPTCAGCDFSGYEGEPPEWPCSTVESVAEHFGVETPRWAVFDD